MQTSNLNKYIINSLVILLGLSGWISSLVIYNEIENQKDRYEQVSVHNAENILFQSLGEVQSLDDVLNKFEQWEERGSTAQTGSLNTICTYNQAAFNKTYPHLTPEMVKEICEL